MPDSTFVYCCLNRTQKLTALTFDRWMGILRRVPETVLWLLSGAAETNEQLKRQAVEKGVAAERLVFAQKKAKPEHLARYPLADLFLDTMPYGSQTTADDAMWMGVPILTLPGRSFASRVCGGLVRSAGIGDMICQSADRYVEKAVELGRDREKPGQIRNRLVSSRDNSLLFDTPQLVSNFEDLYRRMWSEIARGGATAPLTNLEIYYEIGREHDLANIELLSDDAYRSLYQSRLAESHLVYPLDPDGRLWRRRLGSGEQERCMPEPVVKRFIRCGKRRLHPKPPLISSGVSPRKHRASSHP